MTAELRPQLLLGAIAAACAIALAVAAAPAGAATIVINNINAAGVGFNDTTPVAPTGGNTGTTLGEQRLIAFQYAANLWGQVLDSTVPIYINAQFSALDCDATGAVLGSAGAASSVRNFPNAPRADTWYPVALRNKLAGSEVTAGAGQINANFNINLGTANCLAGSPFYLGLDNQPGTAVDLVTVLLHEFGHGLGFAVGPTSASSGVRSSGSPSVWEYSMLDNASGKLWAQMSNAERRASSLSIDKLVWTGANVTAAAPSVLRQGTAQVAISGPSAGSAAGSYVAGDAAFGTPLSTAPFTGQVMPVVDQANGTGLACTPLSSVNTLAVRGNIALVDRGSCAFIDKARNVQAAGARGMIVVDNAASATPAPMTGSDPAVTIPAVRVTLADGNTIKQALKQRSRTSSGVLASLALVGTQFTGADAAGRVKLYAPNPFEGGSSVSHWDVSAYRNLLMEPAINTDLTHSLLPPQDLTFLLLKDIGW